MISLFSSLGSNRLLTGACALALAACSTDTTASDREATATSSQSATADAGSTVPHRSAADASPADNAGAISTSGADDAGSSQPSGDQGGADAQVSSGSADYSWPSDCETHYTFRAHNANGVADTSKKQVAAGAQYYASYYFSAPWTSDEVQGLKFRSLIDNKKVVHHWILYGVDSATQQAGSVQGGMGQQIGSMQGEFYIAGWAPGAPDLTLPDDVGLHLPTGAKAMFRLEVHYFNTSASAVTEEDATGVEFCVTSQKRAHEAAVHWLGTTNVVVPPGTPTDLNSTCRPKITSGPVHLLSLSAHMHTTGVHARATLNRANGDAPVMLIDDPFTFAEQNAYHQPRAGSAADVQINAGDTINVTCSYDNMTGATKRFGSNTEDEMCFFYALAWPRGQLSNGSLSIVPGAEPEVNCIQ